MSQKYQSCLVSRLSRFVSLTDHECAFIAEMEKDEQARKKGRPVVSVGAATDGIMVLKSGWAVVKADSSDGRSQTIISGDTAMSMGNYFFTQTDGSEVKVEYTFGFEQMENGEPKIVLHHSSLPFAAN